MTSITMPWVTRPGTGEAWTATLGEEAEVRYHVARDPELWGGAATVAGTRIPVFLIEDYYKEASDIFVVLDCYRSLTPANIYTALAYAQRFPGRVQGDRARHLMA